MTKTKKEKTKKRYDLRPDMKVQCGSLIWTGKAGSAEEAISASLALRLPEYPAYLLRVWDGNIWQYVDFESALRIAGYTVKKNKHGFKKI